MNYSSISAKILRSLFLIFLIFFFLSFSTIELLRNVSWAQEFPSKEIRLVVPYGPGGLADIIARLHADKVGKVLGFPMVVVNNTAGGGTVGALSVAQAKPDGYTLLHGTSGITIIKTILNPEISYRYTHFTPVSMMTATPFAIWTKDDAPWKSLRDLADYAKKNPGKIRASVGIAGGYLQTLMNLFEIEAGIDITDIATPAGATGVAAAILGGHTELSVDGIPPMIEYFRAGKVRALACTHKIPELPMIKTFEEEGYPGVSLKEWHGIFAPKELPKPILTKLSKAFEQACHDPSLQEQLRKYYLIPDYQSPEETSRLVQSSYETILKILKQTGMAK